jgi:molybdopterin converting factor small subunit
MLLNQPGSKRPELRDTLASDGCSAASALFFASACDTCSMDGPALTIVLFAGLADCLGRREVQIDWSGGTAGELREQLCKLHPDAALLFGRSAIAVGEGYCRDEEPVPPGADVAVIPPVSGG